MPMVVFEAVRRKTRSGSLPCLSSIILTVVLQSSSYKVYDSCHDATVAVVVAEAGKRRLLSRFILVSSA